MGFRNNILLVAVCVIVFIQNRAARASPCGRKEKIRMTVVSYRNYNSESGCPRYECYLGPGDGDAHIDASRPYWTRNDAWRNPEPVLGSFINNLPENTLARNVVLEASSNNAFGAFRCIATKAGKQQTSIMTIFIRHDSYVIPNDRLFTQTVHHGDTGVIIDMSGTSTFRWRINGSDAVSKYFSEDYDRIANEPVTVSDAGLYECHTRGTRNDARHAMKRLIVRACTAGKWGAPSCNGVCDVCYNGGICDDETGRCICPPGFMGTNCLTACGFNRFGYSCEFQCAANGGENSCRGRQFCLLDPFGCRCTTGFQELNCLTQCEPDAFGAGCLQTCHCASGRCNGFTGVCDIGGCEDGWSGTNCQIPDICTDGYYGDNCTEKCRCINNTACNRRTGLCSGEQCAPGSMLNIATRKCEECPDGYFGDSCMEECHCEADACDKVTGECVGCCKHQWVDVYPPTCQQGFTENELLLINPSQTPKASCTYIQAESSVPWFTIGLSSSVSTFEEVSVGEPEMSDSSTIDKDFLQYTLVFSIPSANPGDVFYCQWLDVSNNVHAWVNTTYIVSDLPVLSTAPELVFRNQTSITISWTAWDNGTDVGDPPVVAYIPYYKSFLSDSWENGSTVDFNETLAYTIYGLEADTKYEFAVSAVREGHGGEGPRSENFVIKTLCYEPSVLPTDVTVTLTERNDLNVSWKINTNVKCSTLSYTIYYMAEGSSDAANSVTADGNERWIVISDLEPQQSYSVQVSLTTDGKFDGPRSEITELIRLPEKTNEIHPTSPILFIVPFAVAVGLVAIIVALVLYRRRRNKRTPPSSSTGFTNSVSVNFQRDQSITRDDAPNVYEVSGIPHRKPSLPKEENSRPTTTTPSVRPVVSHELSTRDKEEKLEDCADVPPAADVYQNVQGTITESNLPFYLNKNKDAMQSEFQRLKKGQQFPWTVGAKDENSKKNRFRKMFTYDHSRVVLEQMSGDGDSDYYNASYILDQTGKKSFIASQAPNTASIDGFWTMIWQQEVTTIVMLTNLIENGKDRCYQYWPNNEGVSRRFGSFVVSWAETTHFANFDVRKLQVSQAKEVRTLYQFHYTTWPDMDVPEPSPLIEFIKHVKLRQKDSQSPLLTHCSAGVGRTGTFIALYCLMEVIKAKETISIFEFVEKTRENRINMVQTEIQYIFLYQCLVDYYLTRHTEIPSGLMARFNIETKQDALAEEFDLLSTFQVEGVPSVYENPQDERKSRFPNIAPSMRGRIYLTSMASRGSSNFINATMFTSLMKKNAYITTQSPLPDVIEDFWRLVYDWKCSIIVMLNQLDINDTTCVKYWPEDGSSQYGNMSVTFTGRKKHPTHIHRKFEVVHIRQEGTLTVHQLQLLSWPTGPDFSSIRELTKSLATIEDDPKAVTLVHCIDGAGRSGVFVAVEIALEPVNITGNIDVFSTVREMRQRNNHVVSTQEDYILCYRIIKSLLSADETYQNL